MAEKVIVGLIVLAALVDALVPQAPTEFLMLALVVLGIVHGYLNVDASEPTAYLVFAVAAAAAGGGDVLAHIHYAGTYLDGILDGLVVALLGGVVSVVVVRAINVFQDD